MSKRKYAYVVSVKDITLLAEEECKQSKFYPIHFESFIPYDYETHFYPAFLEWKAPVFCDEHGEWVWHDTITPKEYLEQTLKDIVVERTDLEAQLANIQKQLDDLQMEENFFKRFVE
jgi:hypothetical protein